MSKRKKISFETLKKETADDCEQIANILKELAEKVRQGNTMAFDEFWIEGGTEEGDAKINSLREQIILRYAHRMENLER